jgi:hypothetical protein
LLVEEVEMPQEEVVEEVVEEEVVFQDRSLHNLVVSIGKRHCSYTKQSCSTHRSRYSCGSCCTVLLEVVEVVVVVVEMQ